MKSMKSLLRYRTLGGLLLGLALALLLGHGAGRAACGPGDLSDFCSSNYGLSGNLSAVGGATGATFPAVDNAQLPVAGALLYADYKALEAQARDLLQRNMAFRQDISPYRDNNSFDELVRQFDENSGFDAEYIDPQQEIMTLQQRIDIADDELRRARDLYAYLAVYAPEARLRADDTDPDNDYLNVLCAQAEDPNPPDPEHTGQVLDPVIDWCNFGARLRQSVREAAYLRMIFAQQFMVDALGLHFSAGALIGGDKFVKEEVAKLEAAAYQFELAERGLREALERPLGSGCLVSDFYTQAEWALLSRAAQGWDVAQHHIATRLSYLDINQDSDIPDAQAAAEETYRTAATEGYVKLIGMAGMAVKAPTTGCTAAGTRPDGALVAEMALNMLDTRAKAREMRAGRNIFGFDLAFTPARSYKTAVGSNDQGLWEQAQESAELALGLQQQTEYSERIFDLNQQELVEAITELNNTLDYDIQAAAGCDRQGFNDDSGYFACVETMIEETAKCDPTAADFDACMDRTTDGQPPATDCSNCVILVSTMRQTMQDLRVAWLGVEAAQQHRDNLVTQADNETMRNIEVTNTIFQGAQKISAYEGAIAAANCCSTTIESSGIASFEVNPGAFVEAVLRPLQMMQEAANNIAVEDANSEAVVKNLMLEIAEANIEIESAVQQYNSKLTEYNGVVGQLQHDVFEAKRQRAYLVASPANDPSHRMVRDSRRLELAQALESAARRAYLAVRRAEYEYGARLSASNFRISDIYKARTANDVLIFLSELDGVVANLPGAVSDADTNQSDLTFSVAQHVLGLSDQFLQGQGFSGEAIAAERTRRFRQWVAQQTELGSDGKPVLDFTFTTSGATEGIIGQVVQQGYDYWWLHKVAGTGQPKPTNNGLGLNLVTAQPGSLGYRNVRVSQTGQVSLTSFAGCLFDYRLMPPAVMLGLDFPTTQPTDVVSGAFNGDINGNHGNDAPGYSTPAFLGRPLAANDWQVVIYAGSPDGILPDLDLQQLTDIELKISTTYATRASNAPPELADCVRIDF